MYTTQFLGNSEVMQQVWWGNTLAAYVSALVVFIVLLIAFKVFQSILLSRLMRLAEKTKTDIDDTVIEIVKMVRPRLYSFIAFYVAVQVLVLSGMIGEVLNAVLIIWITMWVVGAVQKLIDYMIKRSTHGDGEANGASAAAGALKTIAKGMLWVFALLMILSNIGVDVTSLIAGLGIGGIAIALALQNILSDLFSSFAIYFDKPFVPGDFIVVGEHLGVVEKIGIKTTRLRALQGEEIVISNKELTSARVQNFKKMSTRRVVLKFGVTYETSSKHMKEIPGMVKEIVEGSEASRFDRAHFKSFDDSVLSFEVVYYVGTGDYNKYMDIQQDINLKIKEAFEKKGISMAYPTQTLYVHKD